MNQSPPKWLAIMLLPLLPVFIVLYCVAFIAAAVGEFFRD